MKQVLSIVLLMLIQAACSGQRVMEYMGRGLSAVPMGLGNAFVSWRSLVTDPPDLGFHVYKLNAKGKPVQLTSQPIIAVTGYVDNQYDSTQVQQYMVREVLGKKLGPSSNVFTLEANARPYFSIPLQTPDGYAPNDGSLGDLDGDGTYELVLHQVGRSKDNSQAGITDPPIIQAYRLDGTLLWSINLGINIREGAHYTQFMVYDLDGDGRAEVAMKTADGSRDALGSIIGDSNKDWRNDRGYILAGPEYLTVFDGLTGKALHTIDYIPARHEKLTPTTEELKALWGDGYGNRMDRFLAGVAYLDGVNPSLVMCRGYYTRTIIAAWDFRDGMLKSRWVFDTNMEGNNAYAGQGNHSLVIADVDDDGKDEIVYGAMTLDDDGTGLYTTGIGHGDALHVSDLDPTRPGLEVFHIQERFAGEGANFRDAKTGEILWKKASVKAGNDGEGPGRGLALDVDPRYPGMECWVAGAGITGMFDARGNKIADRTPACNMGIFWDGDVLREILNSTRIDKWDYINSTTQPLLNAASYNCVHNNGTKANPVLSADIWGDWREEVIYRTADNNELRIFSTPHPTPHKFYTFMQDPQYRLSIVWQNVGYNQPPHPSFFVGDGMQPPLLPNIVILPPAVPVNAKSKKK